MRSSTCMPRQMHDLCWRGSVQGGDGSGGVPQGDTRTQPHLPVTNVWILNQSCCCWPLGQHSVSVAAELCSSHKRLWEKHVTNFTCLNKHFLSFLTSLYSTCITITIVSRHFIEPPSLTLNKRWRLRRKSSGGDKAGPTDRTRRRRYVTVVVWKPGDGDLGQQGQRSLLLLLWLDFSF